MVDGLVVRAENGEAAGATPPRNLGALSLDGRSFENNFVIKIGQKLNTV